MSDHDQCLSCRHARKPQHPAPGQCRCVLTGTLVDVTSVCNGFVPADMARRLADAFRQPADEVGVGVVGEARFASCSSSTTATKSHG